MTQPFRYPEQYGAAEALEDFLGDPSNPEGVLSFKRAVELDERDAYPEEACALLNQWGVHEYYIPVEDGGKLASFEQLLSIIRVVTRRDFTVAVAHVKTYLGAVAVWLVGTDKQRRRLARIIRNRNQVALGLTERGHGADILASEVAATKVANGYLLSGEKWLVNNATRSAALTVFARTDGHGGPRGFSLFLVEKGRLEAAAYDHSPKIKTHGIRGADISGIRFNQCLLPADSLIGSLGSGLEVTLKGFQITRAIVTGLSLGAADTALRTTLSFALSRRLNGRTVFDIPYARGMLVDSFVNLLTCECVAIATMRALHVATDQTSVWSAVAKYFVPTTVENLIARLSAVLGARYYLREGHNWGIFQKILRDNAIASLFDGSTVVNLSAIAQQLRSLADDGRGRGPDDAEEMRSRLEAVFSLNAPLPPFDPKKQDLFNHGRDDILHGMGLALTRLDGLKSTREVESQVLENITMLAKNVVAELRAQDERLLNSGSRYGNTFNQSPETFEQAKRHCTLHAAAACVHMWIHNRNLLGSFFARGEWLALCLNRLLLNLQIERESLPRSYTESVAHELVRQYEEDKLFSIIPFQLTPTEKI